MRTLQDKIVAITGAGSGFGRATALAVAARGAVPVILDVSEPGLDETAKLLAAQGARCARHRLDVRDKARWEEIAQSIVAEFGQVDALVNNAGVMCRPESFLDVAEDHARFIFEVNFWGMFHGMRAFVPHLARRPEANIVNVASTLALIGSPMHGVYCAAKAAMASLTAVVRQELVGTSINISTVFPGPSKTNLGRNVPTESATQREANARNFEKFAITSPEAVAGKIIGAILRNRSLVTTSADGALTQFVQRLAPVSGHALMGKVYRRISDPQQFASLNQLKPRS